MRLAIARFYPYRRPAGRQNPVRKERPLFHRRDCGYFVAHQANGFCFRPMKIKPERSTCSAKLAFSERSRNPDGLLLRR